MRSGGAAQNIIEAPRVEFRGMEIVMFYAYLRRFLNFMRRTFTPKETLIKSLSDFTLEFLYIARNNLTRIASYLRKVMTKLCIKILVKSDSAI